MKDLKVVISSPIDSNLYSLLVNHLCLKEHGIFICGIITLKTLSLKRIKSEYKRIGRSLFVKILNKFFVSNPNKNLLSMSSNSKIAYEDLKFNSLKAMADKYCVPYIKVDDLNSNKTVDFLIKNKPDLILSIGSTIIKKPILEVPTIGVLNVHMGILPEYRGMGVTEWPLIENRVNEIGLGVTLHLMDSNVDTGPIIKKKYINIDGFTSLDDIESRYLDEMVNLMIEGVKMARDKKLSSEPQKNNDIDSGRQYYSAHRRMRIIAEKRLLELK